MSEIQHQPLRSSLRNGLAPRPNSVLGPVEVMEPLMISSVPPLSPPPDFHTGTKGDYSYRIRPLIEAAFKIEPALMFIRVGQKNIVPGLNPRYFRFWPFLKAGS